MAREHKPFGNTDGTTANLDDSYSIDDSDLQIGTVAVVGAKGSGKSFFLRSMHTYLQDHSEFYIDPIQRNVPPTNYIEGFVDLFEDKVHVSQWIQVWKCAILNSVASYLLFHPDLSTKVDDEIIAQIESYTNNLFPYKTPVSVYVQLQRILQCHQTATDMRDYLYSDIWIHIQTIISQALAQTPGIVLFLDSIDEHYHNAPYAWVKCQEGLFYCLRNLYHNNPDFGGKLHIVAAFRDHVLFEIARTYTFTDLLHDPFLRMLKWDESLIHEFLLHRLASLDSCFTFSDSPQSFEDWLKVPTIQCSGKIHPVTDYLLHHTRLLPRDIVALGNNLANEVKKAKHLDASSLTQDAITQVATDLSRSLGREQIALVHSFFQVMLKAGVAYDSTSLRREEIEQLLVGVNTKLITPQHIDRLESPLLNRLPDRYSFLNVLYQNRVLGYAEKGRNIRYYTGGLSLEIPYNPIRYIVHPTAVNLLGL